MNHELYNLIFKVIMKFRESDATNRVGISSSHKELFSYIKRDLPEKGESAEEAIDALVSGVKNALIHSVNPRYFGFVIGGSTPVSIAADWLTSGWDQNAQVYNTSPAAALIEDVVTEWLLELFDLPRGSSIGYVTGAQMANFVGLSIARNSVLADHSWDIDIKGLQKAPHINIICCECCHGTIHSGIRLMGLGTENITTIPADKEGCILIKELKTEILNCEGPTILCLQAGNVNTGAFEKFDEIIDFAHSKNVWVHVDGAFGLWARATTRYKYLTNGIQKADSWSVDAHKWLNVPYDSGMVIVRDSNAHRRLKTTRCAYAGECNNDLRDGSVWVPENSRRARAFVLYATLRKMGRKGVEYQIEKSCDLTKQFELELKSIPSIRILNNVVLNQLLFRIEPQSVTDIDSFNISVTERIQKSGICWMGTTTWKGQTVIRISVSNYLTSEKDISISVISIKTAIDDVISQFKEY
ncbi:MAG: aspartate aminotransferase family protein [archaeon]|nr:aspartate aminotransferase family protein [archaeon]